MSRLNFKFTDDLDYIPIHRRASAVVELSIVKVFELLLIAVLGLAIGFAFVGKANASDLNVRFGTLSGPGLNLSPRIITRRVDPDKAAAWRAACKPFVERVEYGVEYLGFADPRCKYGTPK